MAKEAGPILTPSIVMSQDIPSFQKQIHDGIEVQVHRSGVAIE
jgi:hypothetical protein